MDREYADRYATLEEQHWWFRARRQILRRLLEHEVQWKAGMSVLEAGCGPGLNLYSLYPPECRLQAIEPDPENAERARRRGPVPVTVSTLEELPVKLGDEQFDVITMFDVLEHVKDDASALRMLRERLRPGGWLMLTVPAYQWLWSEHDVVNQHYRRYTRSGLVDRLQQAGYRVQRATYFNALLFPLVAAARFAGRLTGSKQSDFKTGPLDGLWFRIFSSERLWLERASFPCGVSVFVAGRKDG